jgi:hypothetical protein
MPGIAYRTEVTTELPFTPESTLRSTAQEYTHQVAKITLLHLSQRPRRRAVVLPYEFIQTSTNQASGQAATEVRCVPNKTRKHLFHV